MPSPPGILIVDQGESFGGSVLVASVVANWMPQERFRVHVATPLDPSLIRVRAEAATRAVQLRKRYGYVAQAQDRGNRLGQPAALRRVSGWGDFFFRMIRNTGYVRSIAAYLHRHDITVLHLNNGFENIEAHLAGSLAGTRIVVHAHGGSGSSRLTRLLARRARQCVAISQGVRTSLEEAGTPGSRIVVLPNPLTIDPEPFTPEERLSIRSKHGIPDGTTVAGIVGRVIRWKGHLEFLQAASLVLQADPRAHGVIIGEVTDAGEEYGEMVRREVSRLRLDGRITFTGFIGDPREVYGLVDVLVHSSIEPEPFGLVITEAMALGIPVVAANAGGPLEILTDGVDGFLVDPRDHATVAARVNSLFASPATYQQISDAARKSALTRFSPAAYVQRLAQVYDSALSTSGQS